MKARVKKTYVVYSITNQVTSKRYIGITYDASRRKIHHFGKLRRGNHHSIKLQNAFNKYGEDSFAWELLEINVPQSKIKGQEIKWIAMFDSYKKGYNMTIGGDLGIRGSEFAEKEVSWNGVLYPNPRVAAKALGISERALATRLHRGYTSDSQMPIASKPKMFTWNGVTYPDHKSASVALGVSVKTIVRRVAAGITSSKDITRDVKPQPLTWNGLYYPSAASAARALGITQKTMLIRVRKGYTCDDDLTGYGAVRQHTTDKSA